ncbi:hypothetical protein [Streptomyces sp. B6B3]|uniref:hypothetical protein n=1 Tax=Streptomyces sp. B6B3 TaxID=3153570 RepID=UPI00325C3D48
MPHPTPVQIAYGSATVISSTLLLLFLVPTGSTLAVWLVAVVALLLGVVVAVVFASGRAAGQPAAGVRAPAHDRAHEPGPAPGAARDPQDYREPASVSAQASRATTSSPEVALRGR